MTQSERMLSGQGFDEMDLVLDGLSDRIDSKVITEVMSSSMYERVPVRNGAPSRRISSHVRLARQIVFTYYNEVVVWMTKQRFVPLKRAVECFHVSESWEVCFEQTSEGSGGSGSETKESDVSPAKRHCPGSGQGQSLATASTDCDSDDDDKDTRKLGRRGTNTLCWRRWAEAILSHSIEAIHVFDN